MAPNSLTPEQKHTLKLIYVFLKGSTVYFEAIYPIVIPEDQPQITNLLNLGALGIARLVEHFPEIAMWEERVGGAS